MDSLKKYLQGINEDTKDKIISFLFNSKHPDELDQAMNWLKNQVEEYNKILPKLPDMKVEDFQ